MLTRDEIVLLETAANKALKNGDEFSLSVVLTRLANAGIEYELVVAEMDENKGDSND